MTEVANWAEWVRTRGGFPGSDVVGAAIESLLADEKVKALWISGSRAINEADRYSDTDIRIHAPGWSDADFAGWIDELAPASRRLVRLSKLGPTLLNYECVIGHEVAIDLLVFTAGEPVVASDSVVFKALMPLQRQSSLQVVRETPVNAADVQHLLDGATIDQQKFKKLFARGERLGAWFLLEAMRFALLRLVYVAVRGVDCGPKPLHTLASLKHMRRQIVQEGDAAARTWIDMLEASGTLEEQAGKFGELLPKIAAAVTTRFSGVSSRA